MHRSAVLRIFLCLSCCLALAKGFAQPQASRPDIVVKGLMPNAAVLVINGRQHFLKAGNSSPEGVKLIQATSKQALVSYQGQRFELGLSRQIGANYKQNEAREVRLASQRQGHYFGTAVIRGYNVPFLVDTGATSISMSSRMADRLGLRYRDGELIRVATAQGVTLAHEILIASVNVGGIVVNNAKATVIEGDFPIDMLLGNSFLSKVDMRVESGVMILQNRILP
ncbi:TIGR02281 family clan AA aspartic protease [Agaribacterium haliotis]|uniref:TIGR02281 family clan AA aspartic protease n=1 Tax=Agaribacterium haliotis TaxID=2013869 RepID=UPI000BB53F43|nr:TIGR02281 family clan AA aspartic protease [Agaribacterium haliotis]